MRKLLRAYNIYSVRAFPQRKRKRNRSTALEAVTPFFLLSSGWRSCGRILDSEDGAHGGKLYCSLDFRLASCIWYESPTCQGDGIPWAWPFFGFGQMSEYYWSGLVVYCT